MNLRSALQLCLTSACLLGLFSALALAAPTDPNAQNLYWASNKIYRAGLGGGGIVPTANPNGPYSGFLVDRSSESIYVTDATRLRRFDLDGGNEQTVFNFPRNFYNGELALDHLRNQFYLTDSENNAIWRVNRDGSNPVELIHSPNVPGGYPLIDDVALDLVHDKLYWTAWPTSSTVQFRRANLDGTNVETLFSFASRVGDFALDVVGGRIYWTEFGGFQGQGGVFRANLDGSNRQTLAGGLFGTVGIALDLPRGKMYFADHWSSGPTNYDSRIFVANLDGSDRQTFLNLGPLGAAKPYYLSLDSPSVPEPSLCAIVVAIAGLMTAKWRAKR